MDMNCKRETRKVKKLRSGHKSRLGDSRWKRGLKNDLITFRYRESQVRASHWSDGPLWQSYQSSARRTNRFTIQTNRWLKLRIGSSRRCKKEWTYRSSSMRRAESRRSCKRSTIYSKIAPLQNLAAKANPASRTCKIFHRSVRFLVSNPR